MTYLIIAYTLIAVVLTGYGASIWRRTRDADAEIHAVEKRTDIRRPVP